MDVVEDKNLGFESPTFVNTPSPMVGDIVAEAAMKAWGGLDGRKRCDAMLKFARALTASWLTDLAFNVETAWKETKCRQPSVESAEQSSAGEDCADEEPKPAPEPGAEIVVAGPGPDDGAKEPEPRDPRGIPPGTGQIPLTKTVRNQVAHAIATILGEGGRPRTRDILKHPSTPGWLGQPRLRRVLQWCQRNAMWSNAATPGREGIWFIQAPQPPPEGGLAHFVAPQPCPEPGGEIGCAVA